MGKSNHAKTLKVGGKGVRRNWVRENRAMIYLQFSVTTDSKGLTTPCGVGMPSLGLEP